MLKNFFFRTFTLIVFLHSVAGIFAQNPLYKLTDLPLTDLAAFRNPAKNWQLAAKVSGNFNEATLKTQAGTGVLANNFDKTIQYKSDANLLSVLEHGDMYLEIDFMMPKGSNSGIYLQSRYEIQLFDSWGVKEPKSSDCGSIYERWDESRPEGKKGYEGHPARTNACLAPGLWQHLIIQFQAPKFDASGKKTENARFVKVVLNGITLHENVILFGTTRAAAFENEVAKAPFMIQGDHGQVFFRNIKYALLNDFSPKLSDLTYEYYENKDFQTYSEVKPEFLVRKGKTEVLDARLADARDNYYLVFNGKFNAETADTYSFLIRVSGTAKLEIDGKTVIPEKWTWIGAESLTGETLLSAGEHSIKLQILKHTSWAPPGLGLFVQKPNAKPQLLHTPASLPERQPEPFIEVKARTEPEIVRSFMMHEGKKLTHVISVGDPAGVHYSYNLNQAGLLQVWKGNFLNTTQMWYERGEPQLAEALGSIITLTDKCPLAILSDKNTTFPDSLNDRTELIYKGYHLDNQRYPVFHYTYKDVTFDDSFAINQNGKGLTHLLNIKTFPANGVLMAKLAESSQIEQVGKDIFAIDNQRYYLQVISTPNFKPFVREKNGKQELVVEISKSNTTSVVVLYNLFW